MINLPFLDSFLSFFSHDLAIDLGSDTLRIFVKNKGLAVNEPMIAVLNKATGQIVASGKEAKKMIGRVPPHIKIVRPVVQGKIVDFNSASEIIKKHIRELHLSYGLLPKIPKPKVLLSVSSGITSVERKAISDVIYAAGARRVILVSKLQAAGVGAGFDFSSKKGVLIVDFGGSMTEIGVVSENGLIFSKKIKIGGDDLTREIVNFIRLKYGVLIGEAQAEEIKILNDKYVVVRGRDLESSLPRSLKISSSEINETLMNSINMIVENVKETLEKSPPEFLADVLDLGIILVGGASQISGLSSTIRESIKTSVWVAKDPSLSVVLGMSKAFGDKKIYEMIKIKTS